MAKAKKAVPAGFHTVNTQMTIDDCRKAIAWYQRAFGAEPGGVFEGPDGSIMHADFQIGDTSIMCNDPVMGGKGTRAYGGSPVHLWVYVDDCDALFARAVEAGAEVKWPIIDQFWGDRSGTVVDPFGYQWTIATRKEDLTDAEMDQRGKEFFAQMAAQKG